MDLFSWTCGLPLNTAQCERMAHGQDAEITLEAVEACSLEGKFMSLVMESTCPDPHLWSLSFSFGEALYWLCSMNAGVGSGAFENCAGAADEIHVDALRCLLVNKDSLTSLDLIGEFGVQTHFGSGVATLCVLAEGIDEQFVSILREIMSFNTTLITLWLGDAKSLLSFFVKWTIWQHY
eukprot:2866290-Pleurochrysis_carterae.AAC.1